MQKRPGDRAEIFAGTTQTICPDGLKAGQKVADRNTVPLSSKALHIAENVRRRVAEKEWPRGARIPDEAALAIEFGVARATVNKALQLLADEGLLERR
ncbi:MAG: GntR family transcriptional regulator, partial [Rhodobacteraceae bacterium]|nr:GntR family transcriptional regulator [Paracoccaceae bacterium]